MSYPNLPDKHRFAGIVAPAEMLAHRRRGGGLRIDDPPVGFVICLQRGLPERMRWRVRIRRLGRLMGDLYAVRATGGRVGVLTGFGLGAPIVAAQAEELIALGATRLISIALAGGIAADLEPGAVVVATSAIRDEGTSHHYLAPGRVIEGDPGLTEALAGALARRGATVRSGAVWSTDAPYRETREEVAAYAADGVLAVDMELAALFAVARSRGVRAAGVLVVGDSLAEGRWRPPEQLDGMERSLERAYRAAIEVLDGD
ncbi:MAG: nucleoside phosphorylase [Chloroflexi bacterium]|nr:nucleoside phosphorylase [Chloroflexota bacterium]